LKFLFHCRCLQPLKRPGAVILALFWAVLAHALDPEQSLSQYSLRGWKRQNGLPASGVNSIAQSRDGYLWLGTPMGLARFDGVQFKLFDMGQLRSSIVTSLSPSGQNGLWFSLDSGAFGFCDGTSVSGRGRSEWGGSNLTVHCVLESRKSELWIAAQNLAGKLTRESAYEPILNKPGGLDFYDVNTAYEDSRRRVWLGTTRRGLYFWQSGRLNKLADPLLDTLTIRALTEDRRGRLWVGSEQGVLCYDSNFQRQTNSLFPWYETRALLTDSHGTVWVGTSGGGLVRFRDGATASLQKADGLTDDFVTALAEDREGNLWVGTRNGLSQLSDVKIPTLGKAEGLAADVNLSVCASPRAGLWIATSDGCAFYDGHAHPASPDPALGNRYLKRVFESRSGDLYAINGSMEIVVVTAGRVVARYPNSAWPTAFTEDSRGVIAVVGGELLRVSPRSIEPFRFTGRKPLKCWVFNLAVGRDDTLWMASAEGICRIKNGDTQILTGPDPLGGAKANWLCEDSEGIFWAGLDSGIARIKDGRVKMITRDNGLFDNLVYAIVPDDYGALWVSSGRGFFRVSRKVMNDFAEGRAGRVECAAFDSIEAVKTCERNQQEPSGCKTVDGKVWFPTAQGIVMIDPARIPISLIPPAVDIDRVQVNGRWESKPDRLVVKPGSGDLEFDYTALSFAAPQKIRFRYRLEGYDPDWVDAGDRRMAFYTNLKPGHYVFRVIAANADGVWNRSGDTVELELEPYYYQTGWFYVLCIAGAGAGLAGMYTWRVRHLQARQRALQRSRDLLETRVGERTAALRQEVGQREQAQRELERQKRELEREIEERKRMQVEVDQAHRQLIAASRQAGQAEVASNVLHNVGNVLNSVNVSTTLVTERLRRLQVGNLGKVAELMEQHGQELERFLESDEKGRRLPAYLGTLARHLSQEQQALLEELKGLAENVEHIKEIVSMQQAYATVGGVMESVSASELVDSAVKMHMGSFEKHAIVLEREYEPAPAVTVDRHKVLQILVNLLQNAKLACEEGGTAERKRVVVRVGERGKQWVRIEVEDNGVGIGAENLTKIFSHGFTTRKDGHGFGLHSAALAAREMGGTIQARSQGPGKGATFIVELPATPSAEILAESPRGGSQARQPASGRGAERLIGSE
jgi:ligand-binding sensor domain-containing protein/signal transduction histidine kinase